MDLEEQQEIKQGEVFWVLLQKREDGIKFLAMDGWGRYYSTFRLHDALTFRTGDVEIARNIANNMTLGEWVGRPIKITYELVWDS